MSRRRLLSELCKHRELLFKPAAILAEQAKPVLICTTRCSSISSCPSAQREDGYNVDLVQLQKSLQRLQLAVHPDKHSTKGDDVRRLAEQQSSRLNKAFTTLKSPLERAKYLGVLTLRCMQLEVRGLPVREDARLQHSEFLMQVMELREEVDDVAGEEDVRALLAANAERQGAWEGKLLHAFAAGDLGEAQRLVFEMAYWDRIAEELKEKL